MTSDAREARREFCARLRSERERRGTSIAAIAETTKVKASLLDALERGDVSRWPKGIYRRAFFRDYVAAIGLPAEPWLGDFLELFPDEGAPSRVAALAPEAPAPPPAPAAGGLRLTLAEGAAAVRHGLAAGMRAPRRSAPRRLVAALIDVAMVLGVAYAVAWWRGPESFWPALAIAAVGYSTLCTAILGRSLAFPLTSSSSPLVRWVDALRPLASRRRVPASAAPQAPRVGELIGQALRARSVLHETLVRLRTPGLRSRRERQRELSAARRRRAEAASRASVDDVSRAMG